MNKFHVAHFPIGTVFEIDPYVAFGGTSTATVRSVVENGLNSWVIETDIPDDLTGYRYINISWVTKILTRGIGPVIVDRGFRIRKDWYEGQPKHASRYNVHSPIQLAACVGMQFVHDHMLPDWNKMWDECLRPHFKAEGEYYWSISKRKLKKLIKQNINRYSR